MVAKSTSKTPAKKITATKIVAQKTTKTSERVVAKKPATKKVAAAQPKNAVKVKLTQEQIAQMVAENAYFRAERRGFNGGSIELDWLEAEKEIVSSL